MDENEPEVCSYRFRVIYDRLSLGVNATSLREARRKMNFYAVPEPRGSESDMRSDAKSDVCL